MAIPVNISCSLGSNNVAVDVDVCAGASVTVSLSASMTVDPSISYLDWTQVEHIYLDSEITTEVALTGHLGIP